MSFYRKFLTAVAVLAITSPLFADDTNATTTTTATTDAATTQATADQGAVVGNKVNLNTATGKELVKIKGINPAKARAIISYRKKHGDFKSLDELAKVKSLGKLKTTDLKKIQDQLTI